MVTTDVSLLSFHGLSLSLSSSIMLLCNQSSLSCRKSIDCVLDIFVTEEKGPSHELGPDWTIKRGCQRRSETDDISGNIRDKWCDVSVSGPTDEWDEVVYRL